MKNTFTKIALLVLSLALLACISFAVSAEETSGEVKILAQNVIYNDNVSIVYAVDASIEDAKAGNVKVAYYWEGEETVYNAALLDTTVQDNLYEGHPCFATTGVAPKALGKVAYATVYTGDAPAEDAVWKSYSVAEYLYARLYKNGFVNKTEADGKDYNRKLLYQNLLEYAAQAQVIFNYNPDELVTDYSCAYTTHEDVTIGGGKYAFDVDAVYPVYTGSASCVGWIATDLEGNETEYPIEGFAVNGILSIVPKIAVHECADANWNHKCDSCSKVLGTCVDSNADGKCDVCKVYSFSDSKYVSSNSFFIANNPGKSDKVTLDERNYIDNSTDRGEYTAGPFFSLNADPQNAANACLRLNQTQITMTDVNKLSHVYWTPDVQVADGNLVVFEFDFYLDGGAKGNNPNRFYFKFSDDTVERYSGLYTGTYDMDGNGSDESVCRLVVDADGSDRFVYDSWVRIRLVFDNSTHKMYGFVSRDGGVTYSQSENTKSYAADITAVGFTAKDYYATTSFYDNLKCIQTTAEAYGITLN